MIRVACLISSIILYTSGSAWFFLDDVSSPPSCGHSSTQSLSWHHLVDTMSAAEQTYAPNLDTYIPTRHQLQELPLSCEASSITEWYNFFREKEGKYLVPESFIRSKMTTFDAPLTRNAYGKLIWGDPDFGFVGDINGRQSSSVARMTGYGIHARGVERATRHLFERLGYKIQRVPRSDTMIMESLDKGYPVFAYYISTPYPPGAPYFLDWQSPTGRKIRGYVGEHVGLIVGVRTDKDGLITHIRLTEGRSEGVLTMPIAEWRERSQWFAEYIVANKNPPIR